jgi:WD40 repeat protein
MNYFCFGLIQGRVQRLCYILISGNMYIVWVLDIEMKLNHLLHVQDADQIRCMSFHPTGDYLVVGTSHSVIRLYDIMTSQCFVCSIPSHQHTAGVTSVK